MTNIENISSSAQVISLKTAAVRVPEKADRTERPQEVNNSPPAGESGPAPNAPQENTAATPLVNGKDPLEQAAQAIEKFVNDAGANTKLRIDKDDETGRFVYKSVDSESGKVIKQFPPETILQIISKFRDPEGLVLDNKA
jgi:flagellar protein FlaG